MITKFENMETGEIIEVAQDDFELFCECMGHRNYRLIFD